MIGRVNFKRKHRLSKTTIMSFRNLAKHGSDDQLEDFLYRACQIYIANVRDADFVDPEDYLKIKDTVFETVCPYCGETIELDLKELCE